MSKTVVILQSNYIPWKGYFDLLNAADEFVLFDEVQYTRRDWRNRNKIIVDGKSKWLTIPVETKGRYHSSISSIQIADASWAAKHWATIRQAYAKAPYFDTYKEMLATTYAQASELTLLSAVNELFLQRLAEAVGITTRMSHSSAIERTSEAPAERLIEIATALKATRYLSGPAAKAYIDPVLFESAGLELLYADYRGYPVYEQGTMEFEHGVSLIDLLMNVGPQARHHLKSDARPLDLVEQ